MINFFFWQKSGNAHINVAEDGQNFIRILYRSKTLIEQFLTINRLMDRHFSQPW